VIAKVMLVAYFTRTYKSFKGWTKKTLSRSCLLSQLSFSNPKFSIINLNLAAKTRLASGLAKFLYRL